MTEKQQTQQISITVNGQVFELIDELAFVVAAYAERVKQPIQYVVCDSVRSYIRHHDVELWAVLVGK
jgi:hypothetical protein